MSENQKEDTQKREFVKWFSELSKDDVELAGGKGANLGEMYHIEDIEVPPGFVVTSYAYSYFIEKAGIKEKILELLENVDYENLPQLETVSKKIRELIEEKPMPEDLKNEILEAYENLDTRNFDIKKGAALDILKNSTEPVFVAVRSSATMEDSSEASFAGQQETFLNVKGKRELIESIKKCFASIYTTRSIYYRHQKRYNEENTKIAVVVQNMIDSKKSGVVFSKDPTNQTDNIIIEAVWGLGEGIVSGRITPDEYVLSRDLEIINEKISDKKIAITRDSSGNEVILKLNEEESNAKVLQNHEILKIGEIALKLEEHYGKPQDIEFAIENRNVYIVQTRPITTIGEKEKQEQVKGKIILEGEGASPGIGIGKVKVIKDLEDLDKLQEDDVLVTKMTNPDMVVSMKKASAIITDEGGLTSHAAIVSREMGIPAVVGTRDATEKLKDGEIVTVDGTNGKVYLGRALKESKEKIKKVRKKTRTKIKLIVDLPSFAKRAAETGIKSVGLTRIEGIIAESGKHPEYFLKNNKIEEYEEIIYSGLKKIAEHFDIMWVRTSDIRSDEFQDLEGAPQEIEQNPMLGMHGIRYGLRNKQILIAELKALKKLSEEGEKIGVLLPQVISIKEVREVKKILREIEFEKCYLGIMIETPAAVQIINSLCREGIKFISFGTNDLTQYTLAVDRGNQAVQGMYNEMHPAILSQIKYVISICKKYKVKTSICGQAGSRKEMVRFLVESGIDSISVNPDKAEEISEYVFELEKRKKFKKKKFKKRNFRKRRKIIRKETNKRENKNINQIKKDKEEQTNKEENKPQESQQEQKEGTIQNKEESFQEAMTNQENNQQKEQEPAKENQEQQNKEIDFL